MTKYDVIETLARSHRVEEIIQGMTHTPRLNADLQDLSQMVYLALLEYDEQRILSMWTRNEIRFFIARVVMNQLMSVKSPYYQQIRKFALKSDDITTKDWIDE